MACWEELFAGEFGGLVRTVDYEVAPGVAAKALEGHELVDVRLSEFDWLWGLRDALAACKPGRAVGPDAIPVEFTRASGDQYLRLIAQLCQAAGRTGAPFSWRGGTMAAVPRKPAKPLSLSTGRGVLCSSTVGKLYGRCLRRAAVPALVKEAGGTQFGAVPGGGTDLPAVAVQLFLGGAVRRGRTVAAIFTDIKGAFYRILPEIALGPLLSV